MCAALRTGWWWWWDSTLTRLQAENEAATAKLNAVQTSLANYQKDIATVKLAAQVETQQVADMEVQRWEAIRASLEANVTLLNEIAARNQAMQSEKEAREAQARYGLAWLCGIHAVWFFAPC